MSYICPKCLNIQVGEIDDYIRELYEEADAWDIPREFIDKVGIFEAVEYYEKNWDKI